VSAVLRSAAARQSPPQQILLAGGSGLDKTTLARIFAAALFCADRTEASDACGLCDSCRDVTRTGRPQPQKVWRCTKSGHSAHVTVTTPETLMMHQEEDAKAPQTDKRATERH
jgi:hypothetical protein